MSRCEECDGTLLWGGTAGFLPHTENRHAAYRKMLIRYVVRLVLEKAAVRAGHRVVIRFTQTESWAECSCLWSGPDRTDSTYARQDGHQHLYAAGQLLVRYMLRQRGRI